MSSYSAPNGLRIGHVHLHVSDLERSIAFYRDMIGFDLVVELPDIAFMSVAGYHHHLGLNTWGTKGMNTDDVRRPGLYHFALNFPTIEDFTAAVRHLVEAGYPISGASDHRTHLAIYLADPDGNGIELAWDRDPSFWRAFMDETDPEKLRAVTRRLDVAALLDGSAEKFHPHSNDTSANGELK